MKAVTASLALLAAWQLVSPAEALAQAGGEMPTPTRPHVQIEIRDTPRTDHSDRGPLLVQLPDAAEPAKFMSLVHRPFVTSVRPTDSGPEPVITVFHEGLSGTVRATSGVGDSVTVDLAAEFDEIAEVTVKHLTPTVSVQQVQVKSSCVRFVETLVPGDSVQRSMDTPHGRRYFVLSLRPAADKVPE